MDRHLKERLVGAAVLVAAAVILIPEMLSEPKSGSEGTAVSSSGEADGNGVKTYTIDLAAPNTKSAQNSEVPAPAFQETAPAPPPESPVEKSSNTAVTPPAESREPKAAQTQPAQSAPQDRDQKLLQEFTEQGKAGDNKPGKSTEKQPMEKPPVKETPVAKIEPERNSAPAGAGSWAVQVASFGVRATSEKVASDLKAKGYPAFVTSFAATGQTMYRVRVGPVEDRASAEALLKKIKPLHPGAAVVPQ